jgi:heme exporter protein C
VDNWVLVLVFWVAPTLWLLPILVCANASSLRGRSAAGGALLGACTSWVGVAVSVLALGRPEPPPPLRDYFRPLDRITLPGFAGLTTGLFAVAIALIFFYAPTDANQGLSQRIFYFHVPIALTAYAAFGWGAYKALRHLWTRTAGADLESYVAIHQGVVFGTLTLLTGSIWARISWGVWWVWGDDQLVLFLVLFLFYSAYFMLRYSVEPGLQRENMCAVYALFGVVLIPISFLAIRISHSLIHPEVFTSSGPQMTGAQFLTFTIAFYAMLSLFATLYQLELAGKRLDSRLRELRELLA